MSNPSEELTEEEAVELQKYLSAGAPQADEKHSVHTFLDKVRTALDTTKVGYLKEEEVGVPKNPVRTYQNLALISNTIMDNPFLKDFFNSESEIITSSSLSREGKLIDLAVINRRQLEDVTKKPQKKRGFFAKKDEKEE